MNILSRIVLLSMLFLGGCEIFESESGDTRLESLSVSSGSLSPAFAASVFRYSVTVDAAVASINVAAAAFHSKARVTIDGQSGGDATATLEVGENVIAIVVTAEDGTTRTYRIFVTRLTPTYSVGGTVSGLSGELTLQNNGADDLLVSGDGDFTFGLPLDDGSDYEVTILSQPDGQECAVESGSGTLAGGDVTDVAVSCTDLSFSVGGTLSGLNDVITLQNNGGDDLELTGDGAFTFVTELDNGADYEVTISVQPTGQDCTVSNGSGTIDGADVTNVVVDCNELPVKLVAGVVTGLVGTVTLQLNGTSDLLAVSDGVFNFGDQFDGGEAYEVTVLTQPPNQTCAVSNGSGTIGSGHVLDLRVECSGVGIAAGSILDWEWINPTPQGNATQDFASDGNQVVAVGRYGHVQTSADGVTWTTSDSGTNNDLLAVAWGNGTFVAVSQAGTILTSQDGVNWQSQETGFKFFSAIIWDGTRFVVAGTGWVTSTTAGGLVGSSTDGTDWSFATVENTEFGLGDLAWNGSVYVTLHFPNRVLTSPDAVNWMATPLGDANTFLYSVASDGTGFVVTAASGQVFTSPDGAAWSLETEEIPFSGTSVHWDGNRYVALGNDQYATSADGSSWVVHDLDTAAVLGIQGLSSFIRHDGLNIIAHQNGAISTSPDDSSWATSFNNDYLFFGDVIWHDNQYIAGGGGPSIHTSPDGITWTTRYDSMAFQGQVDGIARGDGVYVAVGSGWGQQVLTSPDGITWTPQSLSTEFISLRNVAWGNGQFVAVSTNSVLTSPDGTSWTERTSGFTEDDIVTDVAWNGSTWIATGYRITDQLSGHVWTSADGIDWGIQPALPGPVNSYFDKLEWNGSLFVAVGFSVIGTSADGLSWSMLQTNVGLSEVYWTGSEFLLAGFSPHLVSSTDGSIWSARPVISGDNAGVATNGTSIVLVGLNSGHIVTDSGSGAP